MSPDNHILVVDDDPANIARIKQGLHSLGVGFETAGNGMEALDVLSRRSGPHGFPGIVITDLKMPVMDGLAFLNRAIKVDADLPVILISAYGEIASAVEAIRTGAYDFVERPFEADDLTAKVGRALEKRQLVLDNRRLRADLANRTGIASRLIGDSAAMRTLRDQIVSIAGTDATVLIQGEAGTGKELSAHVLHECSRRSRFRFVTINCGALSADLIGSELFGHERGAFSDAKRRRVGLVESARGGTLLLDEIDSLPLNLQVKLLRMLQERIIVRLGGNEAISVDIRLIATTKSDLLAAAKRHAFREDLYFSLGVARLRVPALNERREDVPLLFEHFAQGFAEYYQQEVPELSGADRERLVSHDWRGNVQELRNVAERFVVNQRRGKAEGIETLLEPTQLPEPADVLVGKSSHERAPPHSLREELSSHLKHHSTGWVVGGALVALTGLSPEHWIGRAFETLEIEAPNFDVRILLVLIGVGMVAGDVISRSVGDHRRSGDVTPSNSTSHHSVAPMSLPTKAANNRTTLRNTKNRLLGAIGPALAASGRLVKRPFR